MQNVSQAWKDNQNNQLVSESFVEISLDLTDPDASANATASSNMAIALSNMNGIIDEVDEQIKRYVTLEPNLWLLDGSGKILPDTILDGNVVEDAGYVGWTMSNSDRSFSTQPIVTLDFPEVYNTTIPGMTITWSEAHGDYPTEFKVTAYNGSTVVAETIVSDNTSVVSSVFMDIQGYNRIEITIEKWCLPYRRARIENIQMGAKKIYTKSDIFSYSNSQETDIISAELPKDTVTFEISNIDRVYDPENATGLSKYLMERQEVVVKYGYKLNDEIEWIKGGTFFLSEWVANENKNSVEFTANSLLEFLDITFTHSLYYEEGRSLYDLATDVLTFADLPLLKNGNVRWYIDESLKDIISLSPLPLDTVANCLQFIANAGECVIKYDRDGVLRIEKNNAVFDDYVVDLHNSFSKPESSLSKPIKNIIVNVYSSVVVDHSGGDSSIATWTKLVNGRVRDLTVGQKLIFEHEQAAVNKSLFNGTSATAVSLIVDYLYTSEYVVTKTGTTQNQLTYALRGQHLESSYIPITLLVSDSGEDITIDNPLITSNERALSVAKWIKNAVLQRNTKSLSWRADPRLDTGDVIENKDVYNTNNLFVTKLDYTYNGAFKATAEGRVI